MLTYTFVILALALVVYASYLHHDLRESRTENLQLNRYIEILEHGVDELHLVNRIQREQVVFVNSELTMSGRLNHSLELRNAELVDKNNNLTQAIELLEYALKNESKIPSQAKAFIASA